MLPECNVRGSWTAAATVIITAPTTTHVGDIGSSIASCCCYCWRYRQIPVSSSSRPRRVALPMKLLIDTRRLTIPASGVARSLRERCAIAPFSRFSAPTSWSVDRICCWPSISFPAVSCFCFLQLLQPTLCSRCFSSFRITRLIRSGLAKLS